MAAEQRPGRYCHCGCGASIDHLRYDAKWAPACGERVMLERKRASNRKRNRKRDRSGRSDKVFKALNPHAHLVSERNEPVKNPRQKFCLVCCGMPWAREPDRFTEGRPGCELPVSTDHGYGIGRCRGCGEAYSPEPPPKPRSCIVSSAGTTARAGELYGASFAAGRPEKKGNK